MIRTLHVIFIVLSTTHSTATWDHFDTGTLEYEGDSKSSVPGLEEQSNRGWCPRQRDGAIQDGCGSAHRVRLTNLVEASAASSIAISRFEDAYRAKPPWDIDGPQPDLARLLDAGLIQRPDQNYPWHRLVTGPLIAAELGDLRRFAGHRPLNCLLAYAGMDPRVRKSGQWSGKLKMSKPGSVVLRTLFIRPPAWPVYTSLALPKFTTITDIKCTNITA